MHGHLFDIVHSDTHTTLQEKGRRHVRNLVISGQLKPGQKLPSMSELAKRWKTSLRTVHMTLSSLSREGMLTSVPRVGTYVNTPEAKLTRVGIVHRHEIFSPSRSEFIHSIHNQLKILLEAQGVEVSTWVDSRPAAQENLRWEALCTAAVERRIQAMIVPESTWQRLEWLRKLPLPAAFFTSALLPNSVHLDTMRFLDLSLESLASQGCRSTGFVIDMELNPESPNIERDSVASLVGHFIDRATDLGLKVQKKWIRLRQKNVTYESGKAFGHRELHELWSQNERPEGLVVGSDTVMEGVIIAALELGVEVPGELKLVSAKNKHIDFLSPFPITYIVVDEQEIAQALIDQIHSQFRGDRCAVSAKWIGYTIGSESEKKSIKRHS